MSARIGRFSWNAIPWFVSAVVLPIKGGKLRCYRIKIETRKAGFVL